MSDSESPLKKTPLNALHRELGAKMVDFGGWDMPVQYSGVMAEHEAVRQRAGLFDVSHMGEITVKGPDALSYLQRITPNDVSKMNDGRCQYNALLYPSGGFVDDILIYRNAEDDYLVVVNASNSDKDFEWMRDQISGDEVEVRNVSDEWAQIAIQGPLAEKVLSRITDVELGPMKYYRFARGTVDGVGAIVSRTGYTGEDGFEVYVPAAEGARIYRALLDAGKDEGVLPAGLGARDTLRLESKMALYGNDIDSDTTPLEADLGWIVKLDKGEFIGSDVLQQQKEEGAEKVLIGFEMIDRGIARHGYPIVSEGAEVGVVTSGTHSPTLKKAIGLAYLPPRLAAEGTEFDILIRGKETRARVVPTPFYKRAR